MEIVTEEEELGGGELLSISLPEDAAPTVSNDRRVVVVHDPLAELAEMAARDALAGGMPSAAATSPVVIVGIEYQDDLETRRSVGELEPASIQEVNHEGKLQERKTAESASIVQHSPAVKTDRAAKVEKALKALQKKGPTRLLGQPRQSRRPSRPKTMSTPHRPRAPGQKERLKA